VHEGARLALPLPMCGFVENNNRPMRLMFRVSLALVRHLLME